MKLFVFAFMLFVNTVCAQQRLHIVPEPVSAKVGKGYFELTKNTVISVRDAGDRKAASFLNNYLKQVYGFQLLVGDKPTKKSLRIATKKFIRAPEKDAYTITVTKDGVSIDGDTYAGTFYGIQTLIQLLPTNYKLKTTNNKLQIQNVTINDHPRFNYRGMHLDVGRHFFPVSFIKKYIDYLALHKMNYFHWHLTEDQGWRIEIKKYPKLTETGAWRNGTIIGRYPGTGNDNKRYGGYYTQEEAKEIVRYAAERHITVIPEIEMPGHSSAAIASYPWLSCFPEKETVIPSHPSEKSKQAKGKKVQETWGVFEDIFCAGKDSTFIFLQNVIDELLNLFPSTYIHIGGDEAPKNHWKICPNCRARIKKEGLKDEHGLQSYFIQRMEKYLNSKGRRLIGWDEILEGGLAPNAVVMSWQGEKGGIEAAKQNHQVVMTPDQYVYLNYSQSRNEDSLTIGGYLPLEKVYGYEPVPDELDASQAKMVLGAQGNLWTEYISNKSIAEYMLFPRMSALSEVLWSPKAKRDWKSFERKLPEVFKRYQLWNTNYSTAYYDLQASVLPTPNYNGLLWKLESNIKEGNIIYVKGPERNATFNYKTPLLVTGDGEYGAALTRKDHTFMSKWLMQKFSFNKATGKKISITNTPNKKYPGQGGAFSLVNGIWSHKGLSYPDWLGFIGDDLEAIVDFGKTTSFTQVKMHTLDQNGSWVYLPKYVEVFVSQDGVNFQSVGRSSEFVKDLLTMGWITVNLPEQSARYIKVVAKNHGVIADGLPGAGNKAWLFADELQVH